jgi:hypothetical protein
MNASLLNLRRFSQRLRDLDDDGLDEAMVSDTIDNIRYFPADTEAATQMQKSLLMQLDRHRARTEDRIVDETQVTSNALQQTAADVVGNTTPNTSEPKRRGVVQPVPTRKLPTAKRSSVFDDTSSAAKIHSLMLDQKVRSSSFLQFLFKRTILNQFLCCMYQDINAQELEKEQESKFKLMEELAGLTDVLKRSTVQINATVVEQNKVCRGKSYGVTMAFYVLHNHPTLYFLSIF